jgi:hypothetical protein
VRSIQLESGRLAQILASIFGGLISLFGTDFSVGGIVAFFAAAFTAANGFKKLADIAETKTKAAKT